MLSQTSSSPGLQSWAFECLSITVFLGLIGWQLFIPPITGLSDNNDFSKVLGPAHVCAAPPDTINTWLVTGYDAGPKCVRDSHLTSTEILLAGFARNLGRPFLGRFRFDLRFSAAVHLAILALVFALFLRRTRRCEPVLRFLLPPAAIFLFTDVAFVAYLNSAFMDNAAWVLLLLVIAIGVIAIGAARGSAFAYAIAGVLLIFAKAQHALIGLPFAGLAMFFAWQQRKLRWGLAALAILAATIWMPLRTPVEYRAISLYNLIFSRLAADNPAILPEVGLGPGDVHLIGTGAFSPGTPLMDPDWSRSFLERTSFSRIIALYLRHPGIAIHRLDYELRDSAHSIRPDYMANYRQADGFPPHSRATRFAVWSDFASTWLYFHPYTLAVLYGLPFLALGFLGIRAARPSLGAYLPLSLTLAVAGLLEFGVCTLADALDTARHLFLFHVISTALLLLSLVPLLIALRHATALVLGSRLFRGVPVSGRVPDFPPSGHRTRQ